VSELRNHLNGLGPQGRPQRLVHQNLDGFRAGLTNDNDDPFAAGPVNGVVLHTDDDADVDADVDADEELDDADTTPLLFLNGNHHGGDTGTT
jgi:hypothetical protein